MNYVDFANELLRTEDLDPGYCVLARADLTQRQMWQFLVCYWCCYHFGVSAWVAEAKSDRVFWERLNTVAVNEGLKFPRASERRHFRGKKAIDQVTLLKIRFKSPEAIINNWCYQDKPTFDSISRRVKQSHGFGDWIAFKIADMTDRVLRNKVDFSNCELGIYDEPRKGAALVLHHDADTPITDGELKDFIAGQVKFWSKKKAPPFKDRGINVQEIETFLCKYKSHYNGRYKVGKDINEISHALLGWGDLSQELRKFVPAFQQGLFND